MYVLFRCLFSFFLLFGWGRVVSICTYSKSSKGDQFHFSFVVITEQTNVDMEEILLFLNKLSEILELNFGCIHRNPPNIKVYQLV
jgi:hypothetical protein